MQQPPSFQIEIPSRVIEISVNRIFDIINRELSLKPVEQLFVLQETITHVKKQFGVDIQKTEFKPNPPKT